MSYSTTTPAGNAGTTQGLTEVTIVNEATDDRYKVATFVADWIGDQCYDHHDPRCQLTFDRIMDGGAAYEFYRRQYLQYLEDWKIASGGIYLDIRPEDAAARPS